MTHSPPTSKQRVTSTPAAFVPRLRPVAAACLTVIASMSLHAQQAAEPTKVDQVVITGIRASIESSIAIKKNSDSIVEAISAEDIGKLPDVSIADSLARLPGLTSQRVDGRGQVISIRGLGPDFTTALLNGREQVSTGDNRSVEFDQYPSELINSAIVYKTPDPSLAAMGLAGTVDMKAVRPLDFKGRVVSFNIRGEQNSNGSLNSNVSATGNRISASYINQFADNTIGVALGFAHLDSPAQEQHYKAWWWDTSANDAIGAANKDKALIGGFEVGARSTNQKRDGLMAVLEFKPNRNFHSTLDLYYSKFETKKYESYLIDDSTNHWGGGTYSNLTNADGIINSGTIAGNRMLVQGDYTHRKDNLSAIGWNNELKLDKWTVIGDLSYSSAKREESKLESTARMAASDTLTFKMPNGGGFPTFTLGKDYTNPSTVLLEETWGRAGASWNPSIKDDLTALKLGAKRGFDGFFNSLDLGLSYSERNKSREYNENFFKLPNGTPVAVGSSLLNGPSDLSFAGIPGVLSYDIVGAMNKYTTYLANIDTNTFGRRWAVHEKVTKAFAKLSFDTDLGKTPIRGNVGAQIIHTDQSSDGYLVDTTGGAGVKTSPYTTGITYTDVLPTFNLTADFGDDRYLRLGSARTVARPRMEDMRAYNSASLAKAFNPDKSPVLINGQQAYGWSGSGGNPALKPWVADQIDISFEKYFGKASYFSAAAYQKYLRNYIYTETGTVDFTGLPNQLGLPVVSNLGPFSRPVNGQGGDIYGLELTAALEGKKLHSALDGFGLVATGAWSHSAIQPYGPKDAKSPLPGWSNRTSNIALYYERGGFSTRISNRYRSEYIGEVAGLFANRAYSPIKAESVVDFQIGYKFETGQFKGLGILFQVNNLNNAPYETVQGTTNAATGFLPQEYNKYGRQYLLGVTYKL